MTLDLTPLARQAGINADLMVSPMIYMYLQADGDETLHWQHTLRAVSGAIEARDTEGNGTALVTLAGELGTDPIRVFITVEKRGATIVARVASTREVFAPTAATSLRNLRKLAA